MSGHTIPRPARGARDIARADALRRLAIDVGRGIALMLFAALVIGALCLLGVFSEEDIGPALVGAGFGLWIDALGSKYFFFRDCDDRSAR